MFDHFPNRIFSTYVHNALYNHTAAAAPTSPSSPSGNFLTVPGLPYQRRRRTDTDSLDETELRDVLDDSPFDNVSIYSSPSMLSIHSAVETSTIKHEEDNSVVCFFSAWPCVCCPSLIW